MSVVTPTLTLVGTTEVDITVEFKPLSDSSITYTLEWKEVHETSFTKSAPVGSGSNSTDTKQQRAVATPLEPGHTYCVRLVCQQNGAAVGGPSKEVICDTEQIGCTPTDSKSCCVVL